MGAAMGTRKVMGEIFSSLSRLNNSGNLENAAETGERYAKNKKDWF
ncbi:hypothetical protein [Bacillus salacetis]|nr:hypothetical protein [Bacillus salacetis]